MQLADGSFFDANANPMTQDINLSVIPTALAKICRFNGHCKWHYSVAQHSIAVYEAVKSIPNASCDLLIAALYHDAHEALTGFGDVNSADKPNTLRLKEGYINERLAQLLDIDPALFKHPAIKLADNLVCYHEHLILMSSVPDNLKECADMHYIPERIVEITWQVAALDFENISKSLL